MLGAIIGDIVGSPYEFDNYRKKDFPLFSENSKFTDDTVLTIALADSLLNCEDEDLLFSSIVNHFQIYGKNYPTSYGERFENWIVRLVDV